MALQVLQEVMGGMVGMIIHRERQAGMVAMAVMVVMPIVGMAAAMVMTVEIITVPVMVTEAIMAAEMAEEIMVVMVVHNRLL